jgi:hypothetical protein
MPADASRRDHRFACNGHIVDNIVMDLPGDVVLLVLVIVVAATILLSLWSWRVIIPVVLVTGIIETHLSLNPVILLYGYNVLPIDMLFIGILVAYILRLGILGRIGITHLCWVALGCMMALALLRGIGSYGLNTAVVTFRQEFYFIVGALYMQSFHWGQKDLDHFAYVWMACASALVVYAILCWVAPSFILLRGDPLYTYFNAHAYLGWRVLPASSTVLIAQAGLIAALLWLRNNRAGIIHLAAIPLLLTVALLYHRSVWLASIAGIGMLVLNRPRLIGRILLPLTVLAVGLVALVIMGGDGVSGALQSAVAEPFNESSTWGWRINNWQNMIPETLAAGPLTTALGWGYGVSFQDMMTGMDLVNPHNAYVAIFLNTGLLGGGLLVVCCMLPLWRVWRGDFTPSRTFDRHTAMALGAMMIVYYIPYSVSFDHGIMLGVLAALGAQCGAVQGRNPSDEVAFSVPTGVSR